MDLTSCKGLNQELKHDVDILGYRITNAEKTKALFRDLMRMHMEIIDVLRVRIGKRTDALDVLKEYVCALDPAHGQIVKLRLLDGLKWSEVAEITGYNLQHVQRIYKAELQRFPPDVWERFCTMWE